MTATLDSGRKRVPHLVFQPAADLATGRLLGFEALLRWCNGAGGHFSPAMLVAWAEERGWVSELNAWVLMEACTQAARWPLHLQVAVNCTSFRLGRAAAALATARALDASGLLPDRLTIEITEAAMDDEEAFVDLDTMARLGVQLAIDDVVSDSSVLIDRPWPAVNTIKVDGHLVGGLDASSDASRTIVEAIVRSSRSLGLCTVAEAVETGAQVAILRELGADAAQGWLFSAPLAADEACALATGASAPRFAVTTAPGLAPGSTTGPGSIA